MGKKRGQISLFILIGIILVVLIGVIIYLLSSQDVEREPEEFTQQAVEKLVESCVERTGEDALKFMGLQGGEAYPIGYPEYLQIGTFILPYHYYHGFNLMLPLDSVEEDQLGRYFAEEMEDCLDIDIWDFDSDFSSAEIKSDIVEYSYRYTAESDENVYEGYVIGEIPSRFRDIYSIAGNITESFVIEPDYIDLSYLAALLDYGYNVVYYVFDNDTLVYNIIDEEVYVDGEPYTYQFAVVFNETN